MIMLSWLFATIILLYLFTFQLPIFFRQQRIGRDEQIFSLVKFRTLKDGPIDLTRRRFWLGNVLRFTSLDELPQLWNVLLGEMSLIGPRPLPVAYLPLFSNEQRIRHTTRPGITGWAQVNGRHQISWPQKFKLDMFYIENLSFNLDLKILFKTVQLFFAFRRDVSLEEKPFTGEV